MADTKANRQALWQSIGETVWDLVVIGGGIVGAGVARDAASRGLKTLLLERSDFASGTSSRSSRLLHGGLRYLAQGRIGLVREASLEKMHLSHFAPHLCQPLPFLFPVWRGTGWYKWQLSIGVFLYDMLCGGRNLGRSTTLSATQTLEIVPGLRAEGLAGATRHFDALTQDARLVLDTLRAAENSGATVLNYAPFLQAQRKNGLWEIVARDEIFRQTHSLKGKSVVNAAGAWADEFPQSGIHLRLTKGIHLVLKKTTLPVSEAIILPEGDRILFVIPWGERIILGTTDTDFKGDPAEVRTEPSDIRYVLDVVNRAFPKSKLVPEDVIATWAGIRPLIAPAKEKAGAPSDISRGHKIRVGDAGWIDVAGGKLTTYRLMAEQTVDQVAIQLGVQLGPCKTAEEVLPHGPFSGVIPPPVSPEVVTEACQKEWAIHLDDLLLRRTSWHYYHPNQWEIAREAAGWMARELGWDADRSEAELQRYAQLADSKPRGL